MQQSLVIALLLGTVKLAEQPYNEALASRDDSNGYPKLWKTLDTASDTPKEKKSVQSFTRKYINPSNGAFKTQWVVDEEAAAKAQAEFDESTKVNKFFITPEIVHDWTGHKYVTTHRCFGGPCKGDDDLLQLSDSQQDVIPNEELNYLNEQAFERKHRAQRAPRQINQLQTEESVTLRNLQGDVIGTFSLGDMQEHRYQHQNNWKEDMVPYSKYEDLESTSKIISENYDKKDKKILSHAEKIVKDQNEAKKAHDDMMANGGRDMSSNRYVDDWTGSTYAEHIYSYGVPKDGKLPEADKTFLPPRDEEERDYTPKETPEELQKAWDAKTFGTQDCTGCSKKEEKKEEKKLAQTSESLVQSGHHHHHVEHSQELLQLDMETGNPDPFDSGLADIDRITKRYEEEDAKKELARKAMTLNGDPRGGIDNIYAASIRHSTPDDDRFMSEVFETYYTGAKGPDGVPNGNRILTKWNAQLASEEILRSWSSVSEGAVQKFIKDNFSQKWETYDSYKTGNIDESDAKPFVRDLLSSMAPAPKVEVNPYEIKTRSSAPPLDEDLPTASTRSIQSSGSNSTSLNSTISTNVTQAAAPSSISNTTTTSSSNSTTASNSNSTSATPVDTPAQPATNSTSRAQLSSEKEAIYWGID